MSRTYDAFGPRTPGDDCDETAECPACSDVDYCDAHWTGEPEALPGSVESLPLWDRRAMARFEERQNELALDREVGA